MEKKKGREKTHSCRSILTIIRFQSVKFAFVVRAHTEENRQNKMYEYERK